MPSFLSFLLLYFLSYFRTLYYLSIVVQFSRINSRPSSRLLSWRALDYYSTFIPVCQHFFRRFYSFVEKMHKIIKHRCYLVHYIQQIHYFQRCQSLSRELFSSFEVDQKHHSKKYLQNKSDQTRRTIERGNVKTSRYYYYGYQNRCHRK